MAEERKAHSHHCPPGGPSRAAPSLSVCKQHWLQEVGGSAYLGSIRLN